MSTTTDQSLATIVWAPALPCHTTSNRLTPALQQFHDAVVAGLCSNPKELPCKYFYDERGARLFEQICEQPEYYLTTTERSIMRKSAAEMADYIEPHVTLIEYGSGNSQKSQQLLDNLRDPVAYIPVDVSRGQLEHTAQLLSASYPEIEVLPVCADFSESFNVPTPRRRSSHTMVYFPGSTIGNFTPNRARKLLKDMVARHHARHVLIGIDLKKDVATLEAAYNDRQGITAAFNLNLLWRINRELGADFRLRQFRHKAVFNARLGRIEMHLVSARDQWASVGNCFFEFKENESICTEYSYKYTLSQFTRLAMIAGMRVVRSWTDKNSLFAVVLLEAHTD